MFKYFSMSFKGSLDCVGLAAVGLDDCEEDVDFPWPPLEPSATEPADVELAVGRIKFPETPETQRDFLIGGK